jgi:hypothetical protein
MYRRDCPYVLPAKASPPQNEMRFPTRLCTTAKQGSTIGAWRLHVCTEVVVADGELAIIARPASATVAAVMGISAFKEANTPRSRLPAIGLG